MHARAPFFEPARACSFARCAYGPLSTSTRCITMLGPRGPSPSSLRPSRKVATKVFTRNARDVGKLCWCGRMRATGWASGHVAYVFEPRLHNALFPGASGLLSLHVGDPERTFSLMNRLTQCIFSKHNKERSTERPQTVNRLAMKCSMSSFYFILEAGCKR